MPAAAESQPALVSRIVLGTAQLGTDYGRRRHCAPLDVGAAHAVLEAAWDAGIRSFDTAPAYGSAVPRLADWLSRTRRLADARVVTKVNPADLARTDAVSDACAPFDGAASLLLLTHGAVTADAFARLADAAASRRAAAGQSVYTAAEVTAAAAAGAARVQAPYNVVDRRQLVAARAAGIPFDGRSVLLQGVLLEAPDVAEHRAPGAGRITAAVVRAAADAGLSAVAALVAAALAGLDGDGRLVVGVDDAAQLDEILDAASASAEDVAAFGHAMTTWCDAAALPPAVLDPRTWS